MRKQYHSWPGADGFEAWDVDRLTELSVNHPVHDVELSSIWVVDTVDWFDETTYPPTVRRVVDHVRFIHEVDVSYPIILGRNGRCMNGMRWILRALLGCRTIIKTVRFEVNSELDYRNCLIDDLPYV